MVCTPTYALRLADVAREVGFPLSDIPVRIVICGAEPGAGVPATKARIQEAWTAKCFDGAGAADVGKHSFECEVQPGGMHVVETSFIIEVRDPTTGEPVAPGEPGELVLTNLDNVGFPVIRVRTADLVKLQTAPCECGRTFWRLKGGILGRVDGALIIRGVLILPSSLENVIRRFREVGEFVVDAYRPGELDEMEIRVELRGAEPDALAAAIATEIRNEFGLRVQVTPLPYGTLPRLDGKVKRFTDHRQAYGTPRQAGVTT
jgi:phenylacetate-CoA ligase